MLAKEGALSSSAARAWAGSEKCADSWAGAEKCCIYLNAVLDEDAILLPINVDYMHELDFAWRWENWGAVYKGLQ